MHGEPCRNQNKEPTINEETAPRQDITAWPQIAKDLWVPNPLTARLNFYNDVLTSLLETTYHLIPPTQFKNYVIEQRITRWKVEKSALRLENKIETYLTKMAKMAVL